MYLKRQWRGLKPDNPRIVRNTFAFAYRGQIWNSKSKNVLPKIGRLHVIVLMLTTDSSVRKPRTVYSTAYMKLIFEIKEKLLLILVYIFHIYPCLLGTQIYMIHPWSESNYCNKVIESSLLLTEHLLYHIRLQLRFVTLWTIPTGTQIICRYVYLILENTFGLCKSQKYLVLPHEIYKRVLQSHSAFCFFSSHDCFAYCR